MGAKKKNKGNKLARMSEEEKVRYLQQRAAIEEEARRRKEQLISTFMKNKLKKEEGFSRLNMAKINQQWRQTLRQIKCVELKQDLENLFKWFNYTANKKNKIIEMLLDDLHEAESQYSRIQRCHMETTDKLIKIHGQRIKQYYQQYKQERDDIYHKACSDISEINCSYTADLDNLQATLYRMEETCEEELTSMTLQHLSKVDELRNNMLTELENLKNSREFQIETLWQNLEILLKSYWEQTEDRQRQYVIMRGTDHENCKQIFDNNQQINVNVDLIKNLKDQFSKAQIMSKERHLQFDSHKDNTRQLLYTLKKKTAEETEYDKQNLIFLNTIADKVTETLKKTLGEGERILHLQSLCRKLETLNEKICPEGQDKSQLTDEEENEVQKQLQKFTEPLAEQISKNVGKLDRFWKRFNRALLEKEALALHLQSLSDERKQLISMLKNYLSDVVVKRPESKVSCANGVQMRNQRPFQELSRKYSFSALSYVEGAQSSLSRWIVSSQKRKT